MPYAAFYATGSIIASNFIPMPIVAGENVIAFLMASSRSLLSASKPMRKSLGLFYL
jgi:hypothetical protein